ncbi:stage III sporulation protein AG [Ectobacillus sp. sgz5001026]|uniref:stage III sporulation protein AG n=1 Tax=Ectobacillus sp. sgz5001026 TaxID=3242473 RepID=UPI0036D24376
MSSNKSNWLHKLLNGFDDEDKGKKRITPKLVLLLLALGILLMFSSDFFQKKQTVPITTQNQSDNGTNEVQVFSQKDPSLSQVEKDEKKFEEQLKNALEGIIGVSDVTVVVNLASSETKVLEKDTVTRNQKTEETDPNGGKRTVDDQSTDSKVVIVREGDKEVPVVTKVDKPLVRGVIITAKGADNIEIKKNILDAVTRLLGVPSHRVSILAKKS